ncbi:hypothetical protein FF38_08011 [Lucilia cuprina]|uniref:Uncharacterized protein n=1 Tax=Lucilia cuprina TaxID=7375 RepID=A0A0L0BNK2_LUCCU|nr:hypothetical protein FF38_08011 [Lucilia cuprina]
MTLLVLVEVCSANINYETVRSIQYSTTGDQLPEGLCSHWSAGRVSFNICVVTVVYNQVSAGKNVGLETNIQSGTTGDRLPEGLCPHWSADFPEIYGPAREKKGQNKPAQKISQKNPSAEASDKTPKCSQQTPKESVPKRFQSVKATGSSSDLDKEGTSWTVIKSKCILHHLSRGQIR